MNEFLDRIQHYSSKRLALLAADLRARLDQREHREPIAIVGIGCRFPGGSDTPEAYWSLIESQREAIAEVPPDRWDAAAHYHPDPDTPGKMNTRWGGWIDGVDRFDAAFFGISPREARSLDPQQRLFLEVAWRALEDAGIPAAEVSQKRVGIYCGISGTDYHGLMRSAGVEAYDAYFASGVAHSMASGRASYVLGATGPSLSIDTACSSSLVAVHHAVQSLRTGECEMALAGGTNLILGPETTIALSRAHMMAPDGRCKAFDAKADGFVRGEGAGVVVLKRLSDAVAAGDRVIAVIRGSAVNQDGRSNGLTAPNGPSQEAVLAAALADAGVRAEEIGFVEAHGTGTALGDPIEVHALGAALGAGRPPERPLAIGSVKSMIGHLEAAAGVAGLIKAALALAHARLPGQANLDQLNPLIDWDGLPVRPQRTTAPWPAQPAAPRRAGVSSFGFSGTNAHVILEEAPASATPVRPARARHLLTVSARSAAAADRLAALRLAEVRRGLPLGDLTPVVNAGRDHFRHRIAVVASTPEEAQAALADPASARRGMAPERPPRICFVFGDAPLAGVSLDPDGAHPDVAAALARAEALAAPWLDGALLAALAAPGSPQHARLAHLGLQLALLEVWTGWGGSPALVLGAGGGEYAAAVAAGVFAPEIAMQLAAGEAAAEAFNPPSLDVLSAATGGSVTDRMADCGYWSGGVPPSDRVQDACRAAAASGATIMLGIGSDEGVSGAASPAADAPLCLPGVSAGAAGLMRMADTLAELYVRGADIDWAAFEDRRASRRIAVAGYPFERERHWIDAPPAGPQAAFASEAPPTFPGREIAQSISEARLFEMSLSLDALPWMADHLVFDAPLLPSPVHIEWALRAAGESFGSDAASVEGLAFYKPIRVADGPRAVQLALGRNSGGHAQIRIATPDDEGGWHAAVEGRAVPPATATDAPGALPPTEHMRGLDRQVEVDALYAQLAGLGLCFGPRFRALAEIRAGAREAMARVVPPAALVDQGGYLIHPAVLDSCLHLIAAALPEGALRHPYLLLGAERVDIFRRPAGTFWCHAKVGPEVANLGASEVFTAEVALVDEAGAAIARFAGLQLKRAAPATLGIAERGRDIRRLFHEVEWRRLPEPQEPEAVLDAVAPGFLARAGDQGLLDRYPAFKHALDGLCAAYVVRALRALGWDVAEGDEVDAQRLRQQLGIGAEHDQLFRRMLEMLVEDGILSAGKSPKVLTTPEAVDVVAARADLARRHPDCAAEIEVVHSCAVELAAVLRGAVDPLALMFPGGSIDMMERLYGGTLPAQVYNRTIGEIAARIAAGLPADRELRILEIGAGTGSATEALLDALDGRAIAYEFTDVSPLFLNRGRERFGDRPGVTFATLDIGTDAGIASHGGGPYDLVIAANVLHATPDLRGTLGRVARLLAAEGALVLLEGTRRQRFGDLTVGMLPGWWAFEDRDLRSYALMPRPDWAALLADAGFRAAVALPRDTAPGTLDEQAIFLARAPRPAAPAERWLAFGDETTGSALKAACRDAGISLDVLAMRPCSAPADLDAALGAAHYAKVILLDPLSRVLDGDMPAKALLEMQSALLWGATEAVRALARQSGGAPQLCCVTQGAQRVAQGERPEPAQASIWGFADTVALEHPEFSCLRIDLDPAAPPSGQAGGLVAALRDPGSESQIALRGSARFVRRLVVRAYPLPAAQPDLDPERTVLITGGFRGLGLATAEWAVGQGARHLLLLGRSDPDPQAQRVVAELRARGAAIETLRCDVSDEAALAEALAVGARALPPISLAIHSAGALADAALLSMERAQLLTVLGAKVAGAWNLARMLPDVEAMVLYSSGASLGGSAGQANHAAANAFEDALAHALDADGRKVVAINWGRWGEIGAGARRDTLSAGQLRPIPPADGLAALGMVIAELRQTGCPQIAVIDAEWSSLAGTPFYADFRAHRQAETAVPQVKAAGRSLRGIIEAAPLGRRGTLVQAEVLRLLRRVIGLREDAALDPRDSFQDLGVDSLMAVELRNLLGEATGLSLPATITFEHPTAGDLAQHVLGLLAKYDAPPAPGKLAARAPTKPPISSQPASPPPGGDAGSRADQEAEPLTDSEFARMLAARLDQIDKELPE